MDGWSIVTGKGPLIAAALHNGHFVNPELELNMKISEADRLREEDPYTGAWTDCAGTQIVVNASRFQTDLNRPKEKSIYLTPEDSWGIPVWKKPLTEAQVSALKKNYDLFYKDVTKLFEEKLKVHKKLFVYDLHTYNHRRGGPGMPPADPQENPEVNLGTENLNKDIWQKLLYRFDHQMKHYIFLGKNLDVRKNVKFKGGHFSKWIYENFGDDVCCIAIEFKKFFMDEWTGKPDTKAHKAIGEVLSFLSEGIKDELVNAGGKL